jgi:CDP-4-dehydro-6-deoxyglucose reductase
MITELPLMAEVSQAEPLTQTILKVILTPHHYVPYQAGQYLQILSANEALSYSIANAPLGAHHYELHLRHSPNNPVHQSLLKDIRLNGEIPIYLPLGDCHVGCLSNQHPVIMIVQGTGFAPIKAMIEQWLSEGVFPPTLLIWLARSPSDWYMQSLVEHWDHHVEFFQWLPLQADLSEQEILEIALRESRFDLSSLQVILAGSFERMHLFRDVGMQLGLKKQQFFSDSFSTATSIQK